MRAVEGKACPAHFLFVEGPVPRRNREATLFLVHDALHGGRFFARVGHCCRGNLREQLVHRRHRPGSLVVQLKIGMRGVAQQSGALRAHLDDARHHSAIVILAPVAASPERYLHQPLSHGTILQGVQRRLPSRIRQA